MRTTLLVTAGIGVAAFLAIPGQVRATECEDDTLVETYAGAPEVCDGIDDNCDGVIPEEELVDEDGDSVPACAECDDTNAQIWVTWYGLGRYEECDGLDNNCDGIVDNIDPALGEPPCSSTSADPATSCSIGNVTDQQIPSYGWIGLLLPAFAITYFRRRQSQSC